MNSIEDVSMFDSNFGLQSTNSQPHLDNFEEYSFAFDAANTITSCRHRDLQEVLDSGNPASTMKNVSNGHALQSQAPPTSTSSNYDTEIEKLRKEFMEMKREFHKMFTSLAHTVAAQGVAFKQLIGEMSPERSESFLRGLKEELRKLPTNPTSKA